MPSLYVAVVTSKLKSKEERDCVIFIFFEKETVNSYKSLLIVKLAKATLSHLSLEVLDPPLQ